MASDNYAPERGIILTLARYKELEEELEELKTVKRKEIANRIKEAIAFGDLSENAEYDEAKKEQAFTEGKIATIENTLRQASVIDNKSISADTIGIGTAVTVLDLEYNEEDTFHIVGATEASPRDMKISYDSPMGNALLGHKVGDEVRFIAPGGQIALKVLNIHVS